MTNLLRPVIDFHMHPGPAWLPTERRLHSGKGIKEHIDKLILDMDEAGIDRAVIMLLDEEWFGNESGIRLMQLYNDNNWEERVAFCAMFDVFRTFEIDNVLKNLKKASRLGVRGIKIHPVLQRITRFDFPEVSALTHQAADLGMFIVVHSYNDDVKNYTNIGLDIVAHIAPEINVPIIIAHAGGIDFSRSVFLAHNYPGIMIDLSYFYQLNDTLNLDYLLQWGLDVLGPNRFLFGSDHPSCPVADYKKKVMNSLNRLKLDESDIAKIMGGNALRILG